MLRRRLTRPTGPADAPQIAWSQTQEEVTIWISISADVKKQHIGFKLTSTQIEVEVQDAPVLAGPLPFAVQPDDSNWQFGKCFLC